MAVKAYQLTIKYPVTLRLRLVTMYTHCWPSEIVKSIAALIIYCDRYYIDFYMGGYYYIIFHNKVHYIHYMNTLGKKLDNIRTKVSIIYILGTTEGENVKKATMTRKNLFSTY